jgi:hypothetical protein
MVFVYYQKKNMVFVYYHERKKVVEKCWYHVLLSLLPEKKHGFCLLPEKKHGFCLLPRA